MREIFIVDYQVYIRKMIQMVLEKNGYITREFGNGNEFLSYIKKMNENENPMLILLDIMMLELSGFEVLKTLNENEKTKDIPIIILSVKNQKEDVLEALKLGAKDYMVKPPDIDLLLKKIKTYTS
jgi:two-component system sensor histidine kinase/response regulator